MEEDQPVTKNELQAMQRYIGLKRELENQIEREHYIPEVTGIASYICLAVES